MIKSEAEDISDGKGVRDVAMATKFCENRQKSNKNVHNYSCMQQTNAMFGFEIGFQLSANSCVTLSYTIGTKGHYHGNEFWN